MLKIIFGFTSDTFLVIIHYEKLCIRRFFMIQFEELRLAVDENFEQGFKLCVQRLIKHIKKSGEQLFELTLLADEYYNKH